MSLKPVGGAVEKDMLFERWYAGFPEAHLAYEGYRELPTLQHRVTQSIAILWGGVAANVLFWLGLAGFFALVAESSSLPRSQAFRVAMLLAFAGSLGQFATGSRTPLLFGALAASLVLVNAGFRGWKRRSFAEEIFLCKKLPLSDQVNRVTRRDSRPELAQTGKMAT
ncbi:hypothetical protein [Lignipirellula cremea]|uniref:hypothetical protein n=1 Tax=Lignipirellula cremea TaxID=2528010 RepID=UPI0011A3ED17|nr:hypothetical protein [Lignipirellula cremea]